MCVCVCVCLCVCVCVCVCLCVCVCDWHQSCMFGVCFMLGVCVCARGFVSVCDWHQSCMSGVCCVCVRGVCVVCVCVGVTPSPFHSFIHSIHSIRSLLLRYIRIGKYYTTTTECLYLLPPMRCLQPVRCSSSLCYV